MKSTFAFGVISAIIFSFFVSCKDPINRGLDVAMRKNAFVNLDSLLTGQAKQLSGKKLVKKIELDGETEELLLILNSAQLMTDLSLFRDLDLNRSGLLDAYDIIDNESSITFNGTGEKGPQKVKINKNQVGQVVSIEGKYSEKNVLFYSSRSYYLEFDTNTSLGLMKYVFSGYQKLLFKDTVHFRMTGEFMSE